MKYCFAATVMLSAASCKKSLDLDIENPNRIDESNFWKTSDHAIQGINAAYANFQKVGAPYSRWLPFYNDIRADEGYSTSPWNELRSVGALNITDYNFPVQFETWDAHWRGVFRANQVIAYVPAIEMDQTLRNRIVGEAKFLRAVYYYNLLNIWGNIPLILQPSRPDDKPAQASMDAVWAQIEKDLTEASAVLPNSYTGNDLGRATKGAAQGYLGRAHMQQKEWQLAADALAWLVTGPGSSLYSLVPNFQDNFKEETENNAEAVFEVQFRQRPENGCDDCPTSNFGTSRPPFFAPPGHGFNDANMHRWVVHEFLREQTATGGRDPRLAVTALYDSTDERGPDFTLVYGQTFASKNYDPGIRNRVWYRKYLNDYKFTNGQFEIFNSGNNFRALRFADVLLLYAEALNNLGRTNDAYAFVDRVRQRAGLAPLARTLNQTQFQAQIEHERILELTGESVRWNDLARWGYFDDAGKIAILRARDPEFANFQLGRNKYMPIPQREIDINPNLTQNPGW